MNNSFLPLIKRNSFLIKSQTVAKSRDAITTRLQNLISKIHKTQQQNETIPEHLMAN